MPHITYTSYKPQSRTLFLIEKATQVLNKYAKQGYRLTLKQLFYQFVKEGLIENTIKSYESLSKAISNGRDAGLIDWDMIVDRKRPVTKRRHWENAEEFMQSAASMFACDIWSGQDVRCEVWVEKESLIQVVEKAASPFGVTAMSSQGYISTSAAWSAAQRMLNSECNEWKIIHLADHDPSGIHLTEDIKTRMEMYVRPYEDHHEETSIEVERIGLNYAQAAKYKLPANVANESDNRFVPYKEVYGEECWELDAMEPMAIEKMIVKEIEKTVTNKAQMKRMRAKEKKERKKLSEMF